MIEQDRRLLLVASMVFAWMAWQYTAWRLRLHAPWALPWLLVGAFTRMA